MSTSEKEFGMRSYHHGDLRSTLIRLGTKMLAESGEASLSLRKLAQRAGVSHNAPYQHFADKNALLAAIAEQGFRILGEAIDSKVQAADQQNAISQINAICSAYLEFALAYPSHLQVMFGSFPNSDYPHVVQQATLTVEKLVGVLRHIDNTGQLRDSSPEDAASFVWMSIHGFCAILNADKLPDSLSHQRSLDALAERFVSMICRALL